MVDYSVLRLRLIVFKSFVSLPALQLLFFFVWYQGRWMKRLQDNKMHTVAEDTGRSAFLYAVRVCVCS